MALIKKYLLVLFFVWGYSSSHRITHLPGLDEPINFGQYSGYLKVNETADNELFYWYVESQSDPSNDPLVLWLNGGPGCSSLLGFFEETGPFYVKKDLTLGINEYSWNREANMVFLESPHGVGFSKSAQPLKYSDNNTAIDSLNFLLEFFKEYPHLKKLDFLIAGESYAGHYIPQLAEKIINFNKNASSDNLINLKGLLIGNPLTELSICYGGTAEFAFSHQLISRDTFDGVRMHCNYTFRNPLSGSILNSTACDSYTNKSYMEQGNINPYNIYADVCLNNIGMERSATSNGMQLLRVLARMENSPYKHHRRRTKLFSPFDPCLDHYVEGYLNRPAVQRAIHAQSTSWAVCSNPVTVSYPQSEVAASMVHYYKDVLFKANLTILIFSGDFDSVVPATSTLYWINGLKLNVTTPWSSWIDSDGQVGGHFFISKELVFTTVRGAGHEVPTYQPMRGFDMYSAFLNYYQRDDKPN